MLNLTWRLFLVGWLCLQTNLVYADAIPEITNWNEITKNLKLSAFKKQKFKRKIKFAILDNGFNGYEQEIGKLLPSRTKYFDGPVTDANQVESKSFHGLFMGILAAQVITKSAADADFDLHLYNAFGYTKFAAAVEQVAKEKYDVVLYSQVWEYGGNGDGKGFINALVNKAIEEGTVWINAAGNFGGLTFSGPVDDKVESQEISIKCQPPAKEQCLLRLVLGWNDFKEDADTGTDKDLDLFLYDNKGKLLGSSERRQKIKEDLTDDMASIFPRELLETTVDKGTYKIKIKNKSGNFSADKDTFRVTAGGYAIEMPKGTYAETLLPPADNKGVIVVGASDDKQSSKSVKNKQPAIYLKSLVTLKDGSKPFSTSNAAAMAAGLSVLHLGTGTEQTQQAVLAKLQLVSRPADEPAPQKRKLRKPAEPDGDPMSPEDFYYYSQYDNFSAPAQPDLPEKSQRVCIRARKLPSSYAAVEEVLSAGGAVAIFSRGRHQILLSQEAQEGLNLTNLKPASGIRYVMTRKGVRQVPMEEIPGLPRNVYELLPLPNLPFCK